MDINQASKLVAQSRTSYPSLAALREAHVELLRQRRLTGDTSELLSEVRNFIEIGSATGALLDVSGDRWAAQSLLDFWANVLVRDRQEPPDASLAEFDYQLAPEIPEEECPYRGLDAFGMTDRRYFFGRQRLLDQLLNHLRQNRFLVVIGASGSGKSSLVLAGLLPALQSGELPDSRNWRYLPPLVPGSNPLANLARAVRPSGVGLTQWIEQQTQSFRQTPDYLAEILNEVNDVPAVVVVDQFEEVFTLCHDDEARQMFVDNLLNLALAPGSRHTVILTMRVDFVAQVARLPVLQKYFEQAEVGVTPLLAGELRDAILKPAELVGLKFEEGVVERLVGDILGEQAGLPLLQFTLLKLWESRSRNRITIEAYRRLGGGRKALEYSADELYNSLIIEDQRTARRILLGLVRIDESLEVTSQRVRKELLYASEAHDRVDRVLNKLIAAKLVRLTEGILPTDTQVEVAHEALIRNWSSLVTWLTEERIRRRQRLSLKAVAEQWARLNRDPNVLWRGIQLDEASKYNDLSDLEAEFVKASHAAIGEELARVNAQIKERTIAAQRLQKLAVALTATMLVAVLAAALALQQWRIALSEKARVEVAEASARQNLTVALDTLAAREAILVSQQQQFMLSTSRPLPSVLLTSEPSSTPDRRVTRELVATPATLMPITPTPNSPIATATALQRQIDEVRATQTAIVTQAGEKDGMRMSHVPAGEYAMGVLGGDLETFRDEAPRHVVSLDAFSIDRTEVTNAMFTRFVSASGYRTEAEIRGWSQVFNVARNVWDVAYGADWRHPRGPNTNLDGMEQHPVVHVSWSDANSYCMWAGRRLPTEAEWEKAARGTDGRVYPWGNDRVVNRFLNFADRSLSIPTAFKDVDDGYQYTAPVGTYPKGASPYGVLDMAGNVWEWVADWYDEFYYDSLSDSVVQNPMGPTSGTFRVVRSGSWYNHPRFVRTTNRRALRSDYIDDTIGFRCVR